MIKFMTMKGPECASPQDVGGGLRLTVASVKNRNQISTQCTNQLNVERQVSPSGPKLVHLDITFASQEWIKSFRVEKDKRFENGGRMESRTLCPHFDSC